MFRDALHRLTTPPYFRSTLLLAGLHLLLGFAYTGVSTYAPALVRRMNEDEYAARTEHVDRANYTDRTFNGSLENVRYTDTLFHNVTFAHVVISHVNFVNCDFYESRFSDVQSSRVLFENSSVRESRFVDTDLTEQHFVHCSLANNTFLTIVSKCGLDFDYNIYQSELYVETVAWTVPMVPALVLVGFLLGSCSRPSVAALFFLLAAAASTAVFFLADRAAVLAVEAVLKTLIVCAAHAVILATVEAYPCHLRCTAHGLLRCLYHVAALLAVPLYTWLVHAPLACAALVTLAACLAAAALATRLQDNSRVLL